MFKERLDMIIFCPNCGMQHIDEPEPMTCQSCGLWGENDCVCEVFNPWLNPPHKSHTCRKDAGGCGVIFRIADFCTNGVESIETVGKDDTWRRPATPRVHALTVLKSARSALISYQYGNSSPDLAAEIVEAIDEAFPEVSR